MQASIDLVERNNSIGFLREDEFVGLTNFTMKFIRKITHVREPDFNGFIIMVKTQPLAGTGQVHSGTVFFPWHKTQQKSLNLAKELGCAVPQSSLFSKLKPSQLLDLFWTKLTEFESNPNASSFVRKPVLTLGQQCNSECIVLAPDIHVKEDGTLIPRSKREFFWVDSIVQSKGIVPRGISYSSELPDCGDESPLDTLLVGLKEITQDNFLSAVFVLGSVVSSMSYVQLKERHGSFGVTIIVGEVNRGKSKSVELCLAALGVRHARYRDISNPFLKKLLLGGMPWCYDDPNSAEQLMDILLNVFDGTTSGNLLSSGSCGVSPIATANNHIMHQLASMDKRVVCRALLIPFIHQLDYKIQSSSTIYNAYELAPAAGPVLIGIGHQLVNIDDDKLEEIKSHVSRVLPGVDSRIVMEYSVLIASALLISDLSSEVSQDSLLDFFDTAFVPVVNKFQSDPVQSMGSYFVQFARVATAYEILQVINPQCSYSVADNNISGVALVLKDLIQALDKYGIEHENESSIRRKLRKRSDVKTTATQFFLKPTAVSLDMDRKNCDPKSCVLIPRGDIPSEFFELLDGKLEEEEQEQNDSGFQDNLLDPSGSDNDSDMGISIKSSLKTPSNQAEDNTQSGPPNSSVSSLETPSNQDGHNTQNGPLNSSAKPGTQKSSFKTPSNQTGDNTQSGPLNSSVSSLETPSNQAGHNTQSGPPNSSAKPGTQKSSLETPSNQTGDNTQSGPPNSSVKPGTQKSSLETPSNQAGDNTQSGPLNSSAKPGTQKFSLETPSKQAGDNTQSGPPNSSAEPGTQKSSLKTPSKQAGENSQSGPPNSSVKPGTRKRPLKVIQLPLSPKKRKTSNRYKQKQGIIDPNRCAKCQGIYKDKDAAKWAGCDYCERWFHTHCVEVSLNKKWKCPFQH